MKSVEYPNYAKFFKKPSDAPKDSVEFIWLGQAGFAFRYNNTTLIIDPYLSDYLSKKYKDGKCEQLVYIKYLILFYFLPYKSIFHLYFSII